jgi:hypothetical protein
MVDGIEDLFEKYCGVLRHQTSGACGKSHDEECVMDDILPSGDGTEIQHLLVMAHYRRVENRDCGLDALLGSHAELKG